MQFSKRDSKQMKIRMPSLLFIVCTVCIFIFFQSGCAVHNAAQKDDLGSGSSGGNNHRYESQALSIKQMPDFSLTGSDTYYSHLKKGEENLLFFWASWCSYCENLVKSKRWVSNQKIIEKNLFSISEDESLESLQKAKPKFPTHLDLEGDCFNKIGLEYIPALIVLDDKGNLLASAQGEEDCGHLLDEYVKNNK